MLTNQYYDMITNKANTGFADHCLQHNHFIDTKKHNTTAQHTKR